jgi:hypothetical protein
MAKARLGARDESCAERKAGEAILFRAYPVAFGDKILLATEDGDTFVLRADPVHAILRTNSIDEPAWASPATGQRHGLHTGRASLVCDQMRRNRG